MNNFTVPCRDAVEVNILTDNLASVQRLLQEKSPGSNITPAYALALCLEITRLSLLGDAE